jgi:hypothetical protein
MCKRCGAFTNSAISNYWTRVPFVEGEADGCYAKWHNGAWWHGCLYAESKHTMFGHLAEHLINPKP